MATSSSSRHVDLGRMIRLDQVEDILNNMMDRLNAQDQTIQALQRLCGGLLSKQRANDAFESLQSSIVDLNIKLEEVKQASTADLGGGRTMSSGEMSALHNMKIQELERAVALCANEADTQREMELQKEQFATKMDKLNNSVTPLELGKTLHQAQNDIAERMKLMEGTMSLKIDRSEMANLQTLATSLEEYDYFRTDTQAKLVEQRDINRKNDIVFEDIERTLQQAEKERKELRGGISRGATQESLDLLTQDVRGIEEVTSDHASKGALQALETVVHEEKGRADGFGKQIGGLLKASDEAHALLATKASIDDMNGRVLRSHFEAVITALGNDVDTKAARDSLHSVDGRVVTVEERIEAESARLSVAMRFVDWFTSRGESYEHNLRLVDKHLRGLTKAADPAERAPFSGQIRFTPNTGDTEGDENAGNRGSTPQSANLGSSFSHV